MPHTVKRILVTGASGRLGGAMVPAFESAGYDVVRLSRSDLDVGDAGLVRTVVRRHGPDAIINCSAYNAVDAAEANPEAAYTVNAHGPAALASAANETGALLVHYGTDFVFDGNASEPYTEDAAPNPLNVYGASKLAGERAAARSRRHYILRVESLFGGAAGNGQRSTIDFMADNLGAGAAVRAAMDRTVSPSHVDDVVRVTRALFEREAPFGTYHCVATGSATWFELAQEIARQLDAVGCVAGVRSELLATSAVRPRFCALSNQKLLDLGIEMPTWRSAVARHLHDRAESSQMQRVRVRIA